MKMLSCNCRTVFPHDCRRVKALSSLLKLVSEDNRLKILCVLQRGEHRVFQMMEHFDLSQSLISHHLADLKEAGLVYDRKEGREVIYNLTEAGYSIMSQLFTLTEKPENLAKRV